MSKVTAKLLFFIFLFLISSHSALAYDPYATSSATVTASVVSTTFNPPTLISPADNAILNNARESLVWKRPSPVPSTPLHHYDVYLDDAVFAASVSDSITTQTYYFYTIRRDDDTFYLDMTSDFTQGYHTWKVVAYDTSGTNQSSETRTFYLDSITPFITLQKVDRQTLNWTTKDYSTIPDINLRDLNVTTANPLLTGEVEPFANMQIILLCPQNILNCTDQTYQGNYPTGTWQHRFYNLIKGLIYTVHLSATDASGNSVIFPEFYLAYGIKTPFPPAIITATISPTPTSEIATPPIALVTPEIEVPPVPFIPVPPPAPTPPIFLTASPVTTTQTTTAVLALFLLVFGLPLHLLMASFGTQTQLANLPNFLYTLLLPFLGHKTLQTLPFCTLEIFHPDEINSTHQKIISDVNGEFSLKAPLPEDLFVKIKSAGRIWKNSIISKSILSIACLFPRLETPETPLNRLRRIFMTYRSIPLGIACFTSGLALVIQPNYFFLIYLYLSLQFTFSEYLYPKLSK